MNILEILKNLISNFDEEGNDYLNFKNAKKCMIKFKLQEADMIVFGFRYIWGITSYRAFFRDVLKKDMLKFNKLMDKIEKKAKIGCNKDILYIRFYSNFQFYIDIPLNVFSLKRSISKEKELWHKKNLERLVNYSDVVKKEIQENY